MKNIVVCCDGTSNQFSGDHTNVIRLFEVVAQDAGQVGFYDPGVGTLPQPGLSSRLAKRWSVLRGLAFGGGFLDNVADAYTYLMQTYAAGDRIYVFGFSRGAYTARALAGLIHAVGLLRPGTENLVRYAMKYWRSHRGDASPGGRLCAEFKRTMARDVVIELIGVWDTVGSVGWVNHLQTFPFTYRNPSVRHVRHAVSIDERRCMFRQNLMVPAFAGQDVQNVWFAGVHADVGGGYPPREAGLAKLAFEWMAVEAEQAGLRIDGAAYEHQLNEVGEGPNVQGQLHASLTGLWWVVEALPIRRYAFRDDKRHWTLSLGRRRDILGRAKAGYVALHASVLERFAALPGYRPKNLPGSVGELKAAFTIAPRVPRPAPAAVPAHS